MFSFLRSVKIHTMVANPAPHSATTPAADWWANLATSLALAQGRRPGAAAVTQATLRLEVLMRTFNKAQRTTILQRVGVSEATWWHWCRRPRKVPGEALSLVLTAAADLYGRQFDHTEVYEPAMPRAHGQQQ